MFIDIRFVLCVSLLAIVLVYILVMFSLALCILWRYVLFVLDMMKCGCDNKEFIVYSIVLFLQYCCCEHC